ncbi:response regulator transcription factor [Salmonella enterica subsp. enterica serovar Bredeney]|nr:response regulator transcription factor [Salmonella enterica subsp. enterica serovar Bredeney]EHS1318611.1 response regulator transcription factor [Salmonella enterica subsp. enterica serovar Reading]
MTKISSWREKNTALLVLTLNEDVKMRIAAFNSGADDCMDFPPDMQELQVRLYAIIQRKNTDISALLRHHDVIFDPDIREVRNGDHYVSLTAKESVLLEIFLLNNKKVLSKRYLEDKLYSWNKSISSNVIEVYISSLRKKLGKEFIKTLPGQGYRLK